MIKNSLVLSLVLLFSTIGHAFQDATYHCKNADGLADNVLILKGIAVGSGDPLPYYDYTYSFSTTDPKEPVMTYVFSGIGSVVKDVGADVENIYMSPRGSSEPVISFSKGGTVPNRCVKMP